MLYILHLMVFPERIFVSRFISNLVYLIVTRLKIVHYAHLVSQFIIFLTTIHWVAVIIILKYLRQTQFQSLLFSLLHL